MFHTTSRTEVALTGTVAANGGDAAIALGAGRLMRRALGDHADTVWFDQDATSISALYPEVDVQPAMRTAAAPLGTGTTLLTRARRRTERTRRQALSRHASRHGASMLLRGAEQTTLRRLLAADVIAATGGTYLVDHYGWESRLPEFELLASAGTPLVFLTQSMGPFDNGSPGIPRLARVLERAVVVLARDEPTVEAVRRIAPSATLRIAPDTAFALTAPRLDAPRTSTGPRIAISVREWQHFTRGGSMQRYLGVMADVVTRLVREREALVTFVSTCQGVPGYRYDDSVTASSLRDMLPRDVAARSRVVEGFVRPEQLVQAFGSFDAVLATRMHASILAWVAGTPSVNVAYETKSSELFDRHRVGHLAHDIETLSPGAVWDSLVAILDAEIESPREIAERTAHERLCLDKVADDLGRRLAPGVTVGSDRSRGNGTS